MSIQTTDLTSHLLEQLDWHWREQLRRRLDGLTDDEYFWEPVPGCWTVRRAGAERPGNEPRRAGAERPGNEPRRAGAKRPGNEPRRAGAERPGNEPSGDGAPMIPDFAYPPPTPEPFTTIAWRLAHVIVGVLAVRAHSHFDGPPADYQSWTYAVDAATALRQLDDAYDHWTAGVRALSADELQRPVGPAEGGFADRPMLDLILHINREVIHHGAEIALLRDLYAHSIHTEEI